MHGTIQDFDGREIPLILNKNAGSWRTPKGQSSFSEVNVISHVSCTGRVFYSAFQPLYGTIVSPYPSSSFFSNVEYSGS